MECGSSFILIEIYSGIRDRNWRWLVSSVQGILCFLRCGALRELLISRMLTFLTVRFIRRRVGTSKRMEKFWLLELYSSISYIRSD